MRLSIIAGSIAILAFAAACGGSSKPAESSPPEAAEPAATPAEQEAAPTEAIAFKDMNHEQRLAFMKQTVLPAMQATFQEFDSKKFAEFNCKTCHGAGVADGSFKMPNPALPVLPGSMDKFMAYAKDPKHEPWVKFMAEKVKPQMAKLLQKPEFDPATNKGEFGCNACHTFEGGEHGAKKDAH